MQYLEEHAPDIPAPRPHRLVAFGNYRVLFMTSIPGSTLAAAWPEMSHEAKLSVQTQLNEIFRRLRTLRRADGAELGGRRRGRQGAPRERRQTLEGHHHGRGVQ